MRELAEKNGYDAKALANMGVHGTDKTFSPAQKNLIALALQDKISSPNSPIGMLVKEDITNEKFYSLISDWAQDIAQNDARTEIVLGNLDKLKAGKTKDFFEKLHLKL
ncbi:hypothetical protein IJV79_02555 [bacterium]|nr:hypothetical protein [bacterium]